MGSFDVVELLKLSTEVKEHYDLWPCSKASRLHAIVQHLVHWFCSSQNTGSIEYSVGPWHRKHSVGHILFNSEFKKFQHNVETDDSSMPILLLEIQGTEIINNVLYKSDFLIEYWFS